MLSVYKASAGSGKTFQLVVEYLKIILENPFNYRHILAVTFTNKATTEMKSRILETLHQLAGNEPSAYISPLQKGNDFSEEFIRKRAKQVLKNILHDYNRFSINTIDSFTQKVIKAFNRELGISPHFTVELDSDIVLEEAVDRLFAKINEDKNLLKWLQEFSKEKIENKRSQRLDDDIKNLGKELFKENFQVFFPDSGESVYKRENLSEFGKELRQIKTGFEQAIKKKGQTLFQQIIQAGFDVDDFSYKATGVAGYLRNTANGVLKEPGTRVTGAAQEVEKWYSAKHKQAAEIHQLVENKLQAGLTDLVNFFSTNFESYNSAIAVLRQLRMLGILSDLREQIKELLVEKGILQISDSNLLLNKIIGESDSPFVYEKIGSFYKHFMLDEFQDTSDLQWKNFKPLLINSLAEGNRNLIVGDVKQSIYRWRNSDWNILAEQLNKEFSDTQKKDFTLEKNWRSDRNIIDFNNAVFGQLIAAFEEYLFKSIDNNEASLEKFRNIYSSYEQQKGLENAVKEGFVQANFLPADDFRESSTQLLIEQVKMLQDKGIGAEEIAILIRKNREGADIIEHFLAAAKLPENQKYNLSVLSNESLFLHASKGVLFVIETIRLLVEPDNAISKAALLHLWQEWLKPELKKRAIALDAGKGQTLLDFGDPEKWTIDSDFEETFSRELAEKLNRAKEKVVLSSLDETITQLCALFGLFNLETELPFLQTLIDKAGELKSSLSNDLSNLLFWWNEKGYKASVNVNEAIRSIRLLTVHKSKGLEYKAVLLPYLNWETGWSGTNAPILWCKPQNPPFNKFPLLPLQAGTAMAASEFKAIFYQEKVNNYIDTLNLVYVAFTRAKSILVANCPEASESRSQGKPLHYLLYKALQNQCKEKTFEDCFDEAGSSFEYGIIPESKKMDESVDSLKIKKYRFNDFSNKIKLRISGDDFLIEENRQSVKNLGKIVHEILSQIETTSDLDKACNKALLDGKLDRSELTEIREIINNNLGLEAAREWFDGTYAVLNERDLLNADKLLRPDRIMTKGNEAIVVDYKTGEKNMKYQRQVKTYAKTLKQTGFEKVNAFLWYLNLNEIEKVDTGT